MINKLMIIIKLYNIVYTHIIQNEHLILLKLIGINWVPEGRSWTRDWGKLAVVVNLAGAW